MILLKFILLILILFVYISKVLEFIYRFQLKEYRWDRLQSYMREEGYGIVLFRPRLLFPKLSIRNLFIFLVLFLSAVIYIWYIYRAPEWLLFVNLMVAPLAAFIDVILVVMLTNIPVYFYRESIIARAKAKLADSNAQIIMITGSYGKTTVKEYLYSMLKKDFSVAKTDDNMNTDIGVAICILKNLKKNTDYFIAEVGAYRVGEIAKICSFVPPNYVVVTAFGNQHLDLYGSKANLVKTESEPLLFLKPDGHAFVNADIPEFEKIKENKKYIMHTYSMKKKSADVSASQVKSNDEGTSATIKIYNHTMQIKTPLLGTHSIQNLLPVIGVANELGIAGGTMLRTLRKINSVKHKLSLHKGPKGSVVLSDAGNSNVNGFLEALTVASQFPQEVKIVATKGIIELGKEKDASYKQIIEMARKLDIQIYTTDSLFAALDSDRCLYFYDEYLLLESVESILDSDTLVVIEGKFPSPFLKKLIK